MDKNTIVEYIEESPQNTNRAILNQMLDEFADTNGTGGADWGQNDPNAKGYVKNRTHYKENKTYVVVKDFETTFIKRVYKDGDFEYIERFLEPNLFPSNLSMDEKDASTLKVVVNEQSIKIIDCQVQDSGSVLWHLENGLIIRYAYKGPRGEPSDSPYYWRIMIGENFEGVDGQKLIFSITIDGVTYVPIDEKYMPETILKWQQPADWTCNNVDDPAYIKNRTHYDYWGKGKCIYDYNFDNNIGLPYTFEVTDDEYNKYNSWLGGHGFMYNDCLFNADSDWKDIGEEYDEELGSWKIKYKCQQTPIYYGDKEKLTINATAYSQYDSEIGEYRHFATINCEYQGPYGIQLYEAEMRSKTLDKRFLSDFSVSKDWSVNDENDPRYIENRTHYPYIGQGIGLMYNVYDFSEHPSNFNNLPYSQKIKTALTANIASGYWLGEEGYWVNIGGGSGIAENYLVDAYSDWKKIGEEGEGSIKIYQCVHNGNWDTEYPCILTVAVQSVEGSSNEHNVELRTVSYRGEISYGVRKAEKMYKTLDEQYLPNGLSINIDWNENNESSHSYIKNRPCYVEEEDTTTILSLETESTVFSTDTGLFYGGQPLIITINGITERVVPSRSDGGSFTKVYSAEASTCTVYSSYYWEGDANSYQSRLTIKTDVVEAPYAITIERVKERMVHQLNSEYIPSDIARINEVVTSVCNKQGNVDLNWTDIGEKIVEEVTILSERSVHSGGWITGSKLQVGETYEVEITDSQYGGIYPITWNPIYSSQNFTLTDGMQLSVDQYSYYSYATFEFTFTKNDGTTSITARVYKPSWIDYKELKEEYIPESIARVSQVEEAVSQIDDLQWSDFGENYSPEQIVLDHGWETSYSEGLYLPTTIKGISDTSIQNGDNVSVILAVFGGSVAEEYDYTATVVNNSFSITNSYYGITIDVVYNSKTNEYSLSSQNEEPLPELFITIIKKEKIEYHPLKDEYIPDTIARAPKATLEDVTEAPTAEQYNALLAILRQAGILAT